MNRLGSIVLSIAVVCGGLAHGAAADVAAGNAAFTAGDFRTARAEWAPAAAQGDIGAQRGLGLLFDQGLGVTADAATAIRWYTPAAAQGDAEAQYRLGRFAAEGRGGPVDAGDAAQWFRKAAVQGHGQAQASLGALYQRGFGVQRNPNEAARWYREAAEQGIAAAQFGLADLYARGDGVGRDPAAARRWYRRADESGHPGAARALAALQKVTAPPDVAVGAPVAGAPPQLLIGPQQGEPIGGSAPAVASDAPRQASLDRILLEWAGDKPDAGDGATAGAGPRAPVLAATPDLWSRWRPMMNSWPQMT